MTGKELREFALKLPDDAEIEMVEAGYTQYKKAFGIRAIIVPRAASSEDEYGN